MIRSPRLVYQQGDHVCTLFSSREEQVNAGIDIDAEEERGALILITKREGHLKGGSFKASRMIDMLTGAVADALKAGFAGS